MQTNYPTARGLYSPDNEHDSCGIGFVAHIKGQKSHDIIRRGLEILVNLNHRGAEGSDDKTGDGAGILMQVPHEFILKQGIKVPQPGKYGTGLIFLPRDEKQADYCIKTLLKNLKDESIELIAFRDVPVDDSTLGEISKAAEPKIIQIFVSSGLEQEEFERKLFVARKITESEIRNSDLSQKGAFYLPSLSTKVIVYKGMLTSLQLGPYYKDLTDESMISAISLVHSRFSTNTFPSWDLAQPFRFIGHNGEINTVKGNRFWMQARESILHSELFGEKIKKLYPIIEPGKSDSASLDNVLEFLVMAGISLPHALTMLIPESWNQKNPISDDLRAYFEYNSTFQEPWDGPASIIFSDGRFVGGLLDRNGLRPSRYLITKDDLFIMGSETGVQVFPAEQIKEKGRLRPGKILMVDTGEGRIIYDPEIKSILADSNPYLKWLKENRVNLEELTTGQEVNNSLGNSYQDLLKVFGYSREDIQTIISSMAVSGMEPTASMGNDVPLAVLSKHPQRLFAYFRQLFAQVTNPPIDPIREELVMSLTGFIGSMQKNMLDPMPDYCKTIKCKNPVINNSQFEIIKNLKYKGFSTVIIPMLFPAAEKEEGLRKAIENLCEKAEAAVDCGKNYIILSDRGVNAEMAPIPSLLAVSAVHHYLITKRKRMQIDIVVESAEPREVMHFALLFGYGASLINPYMCFAILDDIVKQKAIQVDYAKAQENFIKALNKGLLKVLSKMGISTLRSYRASQIFEALGINDEVTQKYFAGTVSRIGGIGLKEIAEEALIPYCDVYQCQNLNKPFDVLNRGLYAFRVEGEKHAWNPETIALLQWSTRTNDYAKFKEYSNAVNNKPEPIFLRDFFEIKKDKAIDISLVEPVEAIFKRFVTGAMSYGSISKEAHETLAIAMNRIGGRSNTGEGGEDTERFKVRPDGSSVRSSIKQVASGRFGVTINYLVNADELQIKIAQGAKPGEGGQLPGHKVNKTIAKTRNSTPGITLISPPPHHDIYSIEDLAQLIFDLKNANPKTTVSVKLVSEAGVGTIAAGVAKAMADLILISGSEGGTGASPASSIKHAGLPFELGLAETQQTLVMNNLREKVRIQTDGQLKTGRDIIIAALLGAEEYGFSTSALIVMGCIMMRKCHLNTCPVGVATQDEELRKRFKGQADNLVHFFTFLAQEVRELLAEMGYTKLDDIVGHSDLISIKKDVPNWKAKHIDLTKIISLPEEAKKNNRRFMKPQAHKIQNVLDLELIKEAKAALENKENVQLIKSIKNTDRATGTMLSGEVAKRYGDEGLPEDTINYKFIGSAGQSFAAFLAKGITFKLEGDTNDYMGKGLSGGKVIVVPPAGSTFKPDENIIIGNTVLYGATSGEIYVSGVAGERFAVRNSGAKAVIEGVGDHCCEYMTGGRVVVIGKTGRNFAAGMSGGIAYVLNEVGNFDYYCNMGLVELSLVEDPTDIKELKDLITNHLLYTNSAKARLILDNWNMYLDKFIKIIPFEYKKVWFEEKMASIQKKLSEVEAGTVNHE
jgi:glutamate synthase (NADPH) large chain